MEHSTSELWLEATKSTAASYRRMIDATVEQLTDSELQERPAPEINSVAILLRHLGGNLRSRWTDFLTADGEKSDRDRDSELQDWSGTRSELMAHFDQGWNALTAALDQIDDSILTKSISIRGELHSIPLGSDSVLNPSDLPRRSNYDGRANGAPRSMALAHHTAGR